MRTNGPQKQVLRLRGTFTKQGNGLGRDAICLLRNFDFNFLQNHPSEAPRTEMKRLEELNHTTKKNGLGDRTATKITRALVGVVAKYLVTRIRDLTHYQQGVGDQVDP